MFKFWVGKNGKSISILPKNASTSIRHAIKGKEYSNTDVLQFSTRIGVIREPHQRIKSCYSWFKHLESVNAISDKHIGVPLNSYEEFVDYILTNNESAHWIPQVDLLENIPTVYHRLEDIEDFWTGYFGGIYPWSYNISPELELPDYRVQDILVKYADDLSLWNSLA